MKLATVVEGDLKVPFSIATIPRCEGRHNSFLRIAPLYFWYSPVLYIYKIIIFTNPTARVGYDTRSIFKWSLMGLNSEFSFSWTSCLTKVEELSLPYYLSIAGGRIIGFIPFPRVLVLCEMQSVLSRIWTLVAVSISYDDNHYTTGTSTRLFTFMLCTSVFFL